jgi:putative transposase
MTERSPFGIDEWYHCYNRGVDKRIIFEDVGDYNRFILLLYLGNGLDPLRLSNLKSRDVRAVIEDQTYEQKNPLIEIGAYALLPNHFHLIIKEIQDGGIATFTQRIFTAFTMYFNKKYDRTGSLFSGPFKSRHIDTDRYLKQVIAYTHLNPAKLFDPKWKENYNYVASLEKKLLAYPYSSLPDFLGQERPERKILGQSVFELFESIPTIQELIADAKLYEP